MNFKKIQKNLNPTKKFKKELLQKLQSEFESQNIAMFNSKPIFFKYAMGFAIVLVAVGACGTGAYAYSSPNVTDGTIFYPIKKSIEKIEEKIKITPQGKANFYLKQIERREAELKAIVKLKLTSTTTLRRIEILQDNLSKTADTIEKKQIKNPVLKQRIEQALKNRIKRLEKSRILIEQKQNKLENIKDKILEIQERQQIQQREPKIQIPAILRPNLTNTTTSGYKMINKTLNTENLSQSTTAQKSAQPGLNSFAQVINTTTPSKQYPITNSYTTSSSKTPAVNESADSSDSNTLKSSSGTTAAVTGPDSQGSSNTSFNR
ncbi:MAG: hypothetical protein ABH832_03625 [bacterium]